MRKQNLVTRRFFIERSKTTDKSYPGDNRLVMVRESISTTIARHLDVGSPQRGAGEGPKRLAVRQLKWHASWVQTVVRQVGLYLLQALTLEGSWP